MPDTMLRVFGWRPLLIHGDPCVLDRWLSLLDGPLSRTSRYPYQSVALCGVKRA
jgi:hypothetical protein